MSRSILSLISGLAVGLAFGLSANSSCQPAFPLPGEKAEEEALYRGQPAGYWLQQLQDRDPALRQQAMWRSHVSAPSRNTSVPLPRCWRISTKGSAPGPP